MNLKNLVVLISPPASGKTFWIESFASSLSEPLMVISPLRTLADECKDKWQDRIKIYTPEEFLIRPSSHPVVIFDEFHLNFFWGDSFRPRMWEAFFEISSRAQTVILMTATLTPEMLEEVRLYSTEFDELVLADFGNQKLKYEPRNYFKLPSKKMLEEFIFLGDRRSGVALIFCPFRQEVFSLARRLEEAGFRVWSCVGGESHLMREKMRTENPPDFIVATTVLSHGVNLPQISTIYFLYELRDINFWIQMVARGGRRGEEFEVYALEKPFNLAWNPVNNFLAISWARLKIERRKYMRQISEWFLKD
jgi:ATP-dependent DNA helicase RecQ